VIYNNYLNIFGINFLIGENPFKDIHLMSFKVFFLQKFVKVEGLAFTEVYSPSIWRRDSVSVLRHSIIDIIDQQNVRLQCLAPDSAKDVDQIPARSSCDISD